MAAIPEECGVCETHVNVIGGHARKGFAEIFSRFVGMGRRLKDRGQGATLPALWGLSGVDHSRMETVRFFLIHVTPPIL
jgi:hypothetical protein